MGALRRLARTPRAAATQPRAPLPRAPRSPRLPEPHAAPARGRFAPSPPERPTTADAASRRPSLANRCHLDSPWAALARAAGALAPARGSARAAPPAGPVHDRRARWRAPPLSGRGRRQSRGERPLSLFISLAGGARSQGEGEG